MHNDKSLISGAIKVILVLRYGGPDRHYHGIAHILWMLTLLERHKDRINHYHLVEAAIWFHDAIYNSKEADNEERSAELMWKFLEDNLSKVELEIIQIMILATKNHEVPEGLDNKLASDIAYLIDFDLQVLGQEPEAFDQYEADVRKEYSWVSDTAWSTGRAKVIQTFLDRDHIYNTEDFRFLYETPARENLKRSLATLGVPR